MELRQARVKQDSLEEGPQDEDLELRQAGLKQDSLEEGPQEENMVVEIRI
jgi:hypothetical protein